MSEKYACFYTNRPFWAVQQLPFENIRTREDFHNLMAEVVFSYEEELFKLRVCRDGMIMLQIPDLEKRNPILSDDKVDLRADVVWWSEYLEYLNCLYVLFESSVLEIMKIAYLELTELTRQNVDRIETEDDKFNGISLNMGSYSYMYQMGRFLSSYNTQPQYDPRIMMRRVFDEEVFKSLSQKASMIFPNRYLVSLLATIGKSLAEYKNGNYSTSLVLAWFVIESIVARQWRDYLDANNKELSNGSKRINSDRMAKLTEGRDYPISVVLNYLELAEIISFADFKEMDKVRDYRNKVVHQNKSFRPTDQHCQEAINLALRLSLRDQNIEIKLNYSFEIRGS